MKNIHTIILCGGLGTRLGDLGKATPKSMVKVFDKPLIWYILNNLYQYGFRKFILPLGYKGSVIRSYIEEELIINESKFSICEFFLIETGERSSITERFLKIQESLELSSDFLVINGDTYFDFDYKAMYKKHIKEKNLLTIATTSIHSKYGLIEEEDAKVTKFIRNMKIKFFHAENSAHIKYYINAGFIILKSTFKDLVSLKTNMEFEEQVFSNIIELNKASKHEIAGDWFAVETQKDLLEVNDKHSHIGSIVYKRKTFLESCAV